MKEKLTCPFCESDNILHFVYGLLSFRSKKNKKEFDKDNIIGGCFIEKDSPAFHCDNSDRNFGKWLSNTRRKK